MGLDPSQTAAGALAQNVSLAVDELARREAVLRRHGAEFLAAPAERGGSTFCPNSHYISVRRHQRR